MSNWKHCKNPHCDRRAAHGFLFCCPGCWQANRDGYEIHDDGPLAHTSQCNERHSNVKAQQAMNTLNWLTGGRSGR